MDEKHDAAASRDSAPKRKRAPRDPEGRKRAIVEAAAEIIGTEGSHRLTHRRVAQRAGVPLGSTTQYFENIGELRRAGIAALQEYIEADYDAMFADVERLGGTPDAIAEVINAYLADTKQVKFDTAFYFAALEDPAVRTLAKQAFEMSVRRCLPYMDEKKAIALSALLDGAMVDTALHDAPLDPDVVTFAVKAIVEAA